jgi:hypothetical protein
MTEPTINEKVIVRILENAGRIYGDLPVERAGEAREFRAALDLAIAVIKARPVHRKAKGKNPEIRQPSLRVMNGKASRPRAIKSASPTQELRATA